MFRALAVVLGLTAFSVLTTDGQQPARGVSAKLPDGQMVTMPSLLNRQMPTIASGPSAVIGDVDVETVVSADGAVTHARVAKSPDPSGVLDRACVAALQQWRFEPARSGQAVNNRAVAALVLVRFSIAQRAANAAPVVTANLTTVDSSLPAQAWTHATGQAALQPGNGVKWPTVVREVQPSYTPAAMRAKIQGSVEMELIVGDDGTVAAAKIIKGLDPEFGLDKAALLAARYWVFTPGTRDGAAVPIRVGLVLEFKLN